MKQEAEAREQARQQEAEAKEEARQQEADAKEETRKQEFEAKEFEAFKKESEATQGLSTQLNTGR